MIENVLPNDAQQTASPAKVNWRQACFFLGLTFALTLLLDFILWRTVGYGANLSTGLLLQTQMLLPAFSAILLSLFIFKDSPIYFKTYHGRARWFFYVFLAYTVIFVLLSGASVLSPSLNLQISLVAASATYLGLLLLIAIRIISGRDAFSQAGLKGGKLIEWVFYGAAFILFYALQTALNAMFGLGTPVNQVDFLVSQGVPLEGMSVNVILFLIAFQTILIAPFQGLLFGFGEEYGWRGYLQGELVKLGKIRGILIVGMIWGIWHWPVIWMGHNYPGYPLWGTFLMTGYTILLGFILGYVMLKTRAIWLVAFLHALNNQVFSYLAAMVHMPNHPIFSFGLGFYGILTMIPIVLLLFLDPIWKDKGLSPESQ